MCILAWLEHCSDQSAASDGTICFIKHVGVQIRSDINRQAVDKNNRRCVCDLICWNSLTEIKDYRSTWPKISIHKRVCYQKKQRCNCAACLDIFKSVWRWTPHSLSSFLFKASLQQLFCCCCLLISLCIFKRTITPTKTDVNCFSSSAVSFTGIKRIRGTTFAANKSKGERRQEIERKRQEGWNSSKLSTRKVEFALENGGVEYVRLIILTCRSAKGVIRDAAVFLIYFLRSSSFHRLLEDG